MWERKPRSKVGETGNDSDQETWTLGADEHLEETATESDSEQSVEHVDLCTPEKKPDMLWREELFTTPIYGNSGPRREEITEMCIGLLQYFGQNEPEIAKLLSLCLSRSILFSKTINRSFETIFQSTYSSVLDLLFF